MYLPVRLVIGGLTPGAGIVCGPCCKEIPMTLMPLTVPTIKKDSLNYF